MYFPLFLPLCEICKENKGNFYLHPAFKLFFSGGFQYFCQCIAKINNFYFLSLGWSDDVFMFRTIIADNSFNGHTLFPKINVLSIHKPHPYEVLRNMIFEFAGLQVGSLL